MAEVTMIRCDHCGQVVDPSSRALLRLEGSLRRINLGSGEPSRLDNPHLCSAQCVIAVMRKALDEVCNGEGRGA